MANAFVAHRLTTPKRPSGDDCGTLRAEVWKHDPADLSTLPCRVHQADADPDRPIVSRLSFDTWVAGRPDSTPPTPEPIWFEDETHPPTYELRVWSEKDGWTTLAWLVGGRHWAGIVAALLRVGTGGPYAWAETWGPRHPDIWAQDWTQEGRLLTDYHPAVPRSAQVAARREMRENHLNAALAERSRGVLTPEQIAARLQAGGPAYKDFLTVGAVCVMDALHRRRLATEGAERLRVREALDALEERHEVADWVIELTRAHLATNPDPHHTTAQRAYRLRALQEYLSPGVDTDGIPGLSTS